ncbi:MAG: hypothetical protein V4608_03235 [Bacteroidota bacterium]
MNKTESNNGVANLHFKNTDWVITKNGIEEKPIMDATGDRIPFEVKKTDPLLIINSKPDEKGNPHYSIRSGDLGLLIQCHFARFLYNTSDFNWNVSFNKVSAIEPTLTNTHFISKCSAIGYLLYSGHDKDGTKAVIANEIPPDSGSVIGRTGKSLLAQAISKMVPTVTVQGKRRDINTDRFLFECVDAGTKVVNIDDAKRNFNFENLFPFVGGDWIIKRKRKEDLIIPRESAPKLYISTINKIKGQGGSFDRRMHVITFSNYYNEKRSPRQELSIFFQDWDKNQWNLFYNFMANCIQIYFEHGLVASPQVK